MVKADNPLFLAVFGNNTRNRSRRPKISPPVPFPIFSVLSSLIVFVALSTLSGVYVGVVHRTYNHRPTTVFSAPRFDRVVADNRSGESGSIVVEKVESAPSAPAGDGGGGGRGDRGNNNDSDGGGSGGGVIRSLKDLTLSELRPRAGPHRHIVDPPPDDDPKYPLTLVKCITTVGPLHIAVHRSWAPLGAGRFLDMVRSDYFSSRVALMRCLSGFLCQFGIAGDPKLNKRYKKSLEDDPNWLPEGPSHKKNEVGVKRYNKGYLAFAGGGKHSRTNQLIVALADNGPLGGGSPWEVPWGEVVGKASFETLEKIYTGYGEKGPSQGRLSREGSSEQVAKDFPKLDYVTSCEVLDTAQPGAGSEQSLSRKG